MSIYESTHLPANCTEIGYKVACTLVINIEVNGNALTPTWRGSYEKIEISMFNRDYLATYTVKFSPIPRQGGCQFEIFDTITMMQIRMKKGLAPYFLSFPLFSFHIKRIQRSNCDPSQKRTTIETGRIYHDSFVFNKRIDYTPAGRFTFFLDNMLR